MLWKPSSALLVCSLMLTAALAFPGAAAALQWTQYSPGHFRVSADLPADASIVASATRLYGFYAIRPPNWGYSALWPYPEESLITTWPVEFQGTVPASDHVLRIGVYDGVTVLKHLYLANVYSTGYPGAGDLTADGAAIRDSVDALRSAVGSMTSGATTLPIQVAEVGAFDSSALNAIGTVGVFALGAAVLAGVSQAVRQ